MDIDDHAARGERAGLSLDGLSLGDGFGERFFGPTALIEARIAARALPPSPWYYTDDTEMALAVVEVLTQRGLIDPDALALAFARRYHRDPQRGYGGTAHQILRAIGLGERWEVVAPAAFGGQGSMGNGAASRRRCGRRSRGAVSLDGSGRAARVKSVIIGSTPLKHHAALIICLLLGPGCPIGPDTSDSGASTAGSTSATGSTSGAPTTTNVATTGDSEGTSASGTSTSGTSTSGTSTSGSGTSGSGTSGSGTSGTGTSGTTGVAACDAIIGSTDCMALVEVSGDLTLEECLTCQGSPCGLDPSCDQYPCVNGSVVIQGCCTDAQCAELTPYCGMFIGTDNVCVKDDDI